jgi:hypothetical protein
MKSSEPKAIMTEIFEKLFNAHFYRCGSHPPDVLEKMLAESIALVQSGTRRMKREDLVPYEARTQTWFVINDTNLPVSSVAHTILHSDKSQAFLDQLICWMSDKKILPAFALKDVEGEEFRTFVFTDAVVVKRKELRSQLDILVEMEAITSRLYHSFKHFSPEIHACVSDLGESVGHLVNLLDPSRPVAEKVRAEQYFQNLQTQN